MKTELIKIKGSETYILATDSNWINVNKIHGEKNTIEPVAGAKAVMKDLKDNQSVCWGDGETYHFILTKK